MAHSHRIKNEVERSFAYCANPAQCDPRAHGWVTVWQECACGATRQANANGQWVERSSWTS